MVELQDNNKEMIEASGPSKGRREIVAVRGVSLTPSHMVIRTQGEMCY